MANRMALFSELDLITLLYAFLDDEMSELLDAGVASPAFSQASELLSRLDEVAMDFQEAGLFQF